MNSLFQDTPEFKTKLYDNNCISIGSASKGNRIVSARKAKEVAEKPFDDISFKVERSASQLIERRSKRR
jgi:hypothetical protein